MPASFATTSGRRHEAVTVNVTSLTPATVYVINYSNIAGIGAARSEFTTDGSGNATLTFVPQSPTISTPVTFTINPKVTAAAVTSTNTFTVV